MRKKRNYITDNRTFDNFDKIRAFYIDGSKLSDLQEKKRLQYEQAHQLRLTGYSKDQTIQILLGKNVVGSQREAYQVTNNSEMLFGDVAAANKEGLRVILSENFLRLYQKAVKDENIKEANRALENVARLNSLYKEEDPINWDKIFIPVPVYSSNPKTLFQKSITEAEIITTE
jgi:hypothetical protein